MFLHVERWPRSLYALNVKRNASLCILGWLAHASNDGDGSRVVTQLNDGIPTKDLNHSRGGSSSI